MSRSFWVPLAVVAALLVLAGCGGRAEEPVAADEKAAETRAAGAGDGKLDFAPATYREGDRVVLPITFPDGTRAELLYPPALEIAELGVVPYGSGTLHGESPIPGRSDYGRDGLTWPHYDGLIWPHPRPIAARPFGLLGARAGGRREDGIEGGAV